MIVKNFTTILYVTGGITMLAVMQFLFPATMLGLSGLQVTGGASVAFAQHWGLVVFSCGMLLIYAARNETARRPIVMAVGLEKLGLVVLVALGWNDSALAGLRPAAFGDAITVALYAVYLLRAK